MPPRKKYNQEQIVEIMRSVGKVHLSKKDVDVLPNLSSSTVIRAFGTWKNALNAAGLQEGIKTGRKPKHVKPNLMSRKKEWVGGIDFPETDNIEDKTYYANDLIVWKGQELSRKYLRSINEDQRDEIAKDLLNFFIQYDFVNDFKYRGEDVRKSWESLLRNPSAIEETDGVKYLKNSGTAGYKLYRNFFPNIIKIKEMGKRMSIWEAVNDREVLWKIIRNRIGNTLLYGGEANKDLGYLQFPMNISPSQIVIGGKNSGLCSMTSIFKPNVAKAIYKQYVKNGDVVLDYSCGFGTRLLGLMSCGLDVRYIGFEPNTETYNGLIRLIDEMGFNAEIKCCGSEVEVFDERVDFCFSSPPYYDSEVYSLEETQSIVKFPKYEDWLEGYWRQTVKNIKHMLKNDGLFAINVGGKSNDKMKELEEDMNKIIMEEGFELCDEIYMKTSKSHLSGKKGSGVSFKLEGIFVYRRK